MIKMSSVNTPTQTITEKGINQSTQTDISITAVIQGAQAQSWTSSAYLQREMQTIISPHCSKDFDIDKQCQHTNSHDFRDMNQSVSTNKHIYRSSHRRGAVLVPHTVLHTYSLKCKPLHRQIVHKMMINMRSVNSSTQTKY